MTERKKPGNKAEGLKGERLVAFSFLLRIHGISTIIELFPGGRKKHE